MNFDAQPKVTPCNNGEKSTSGKNDRTKADTGIMKLVRLIPGRVSTNSRLPGGELFFGTLKERKKKINWGQTHLGGN